ncbi:MAG: Maf family protein [Eubacteriales bacterium]|nr:Maf family protein [Eubacteriales bacterium]
MKLILASGSPRRKELLEQIGLEFEVITSNADENTESASPDEIVCDLSRLKAMGVFNQLNKKKDAQEYAVIGADTIVYFNGKVYGKPVGEQMAYDMINSLSGNVHQVYTGVTVVCSNGKVKSFAEKTDVEVCAMSEKEILDYIKTKEPFDKAGGYGIQGAFAAFVKGIKGDYNNVVGLPVSRLYQELKNMEGVL